MAPYLGLLQRWNVWNTSATTVMQRSKTTDAGLKYWKPTSNGQRFRVTVNANVWKGKPFKPLTKGISRTGGRNSSGRITSWHIGGGHRKKYRRISFAHDAALEGHQGIIQRIEYDPNRSGHIALVKYRKGLGQKAIYTYMLAPQNIGPGGTVMSGTDVPIKPGNTLPLSNIPAGQKIYNIELTPGKGAQLCRAAGCTSTLVQKANDGFAVVRLPSGEQRKVLSGCTATIGTVSNPQRMNRVLGKGGVTRWMGRRPVVRGVAMNPIDHPHGGGEGRTSGGRPSCTPWGKPTKGRRTRNNKRTDRFIVLSRHKAKKR